MKSLKVLGEDYCLVEGRSGEDNVEFIDNQIVLNKNTRAAQKILKESLSDLLATEMYNIFNEIIGENKIDVLGNLRFEIVEKIDNKKRRIAKLEGNKIMVKINAISLPKEALRYIITHEMAHLVTKKHNGKFWKIVGTVYPEYKQGEKAFKDHEDYLSQSIVEMLE